MNRKMFFAQNIMTPIEGLGYGYLYNGYATEHANFAPSGWHVPTLTECNTLSTYLGGYDLAGGKMKETGYARWNSPNTDATNESGFYGAGSGFRNYTTGIFDGLKEGMYFAVTTKISSSAFYLARLYNNTSRFWCGFIDSTAPLSFYMQGNAVRLIKNSTTLSDGETSTMTDYDGNVYDTICIGTQEWTVQNWKCTKLNDGTPLTKVTSNTTWANAGAGDLYYCAYNNDEFYV